MGIYENSFRRIMSGSNGKHIFTLNEIAHQAMLARGFVPDLPEPALRELSLLSSPASPSPLHPVRDMRDFLWISIDNDDSKDLDQLTFAEKDGTGKDRIYVAVADVDALVKHMSAIDRLASINTTSVYTPTKVFPMLPLKLSTDLTSLNENSDRCAIVVEMEIEKDGKFDLHGIYPALVRNHAKLAYNHVAAWLEGKVPQPHPTENIESLPDQIKLQDKIAQHIKEFRYRQGALSFGTIEVQPVIMEGLVVDLVETTHNRANALIENFMIAANVGMTKFLMSKNLPVIKRIVETPKRWDRIVSLAKEKGDKLPSQPDVKALRDFLLKQRKIDPMHFPDLSLAVIKLVGKGEYIASFPGRASPGHFDLALLDYAHTTAPNRRYPDLIMQRLLKSCFFSDAYHYNNEELKGLAAHCTLKEDDAMKVERRVRKSAAAIVLSGKIGHEFDAMVTGASDKGTWVRLYTPPLEGKLTQGSQGVDVGDHIRVKLIYVDINNGYIDFARV